MLLGQESHLWELDAEPEKGYRETGNEEGGLKAEVSAAGAPPAPTSRHLTGNSFRPLFLGESKTTGITLCGAWL